MYSKQLEFKYKNYIQLMVSTKVYGSSVLSSNCMLRLFMVIKSSPKQTEMKRPEEHTHVISSTFQQGRDPD